MGAVCAVAALTAGTPGAGEDRTPVFGDGADCESIEACVQVVRTRSLPSDRPIKPTQRLATYGDAGVVALMKLLDDPDPVVRARAARALSVFPRIEARHAPTLMRLFQAGVPLQGALARTGTDEALALLWSRLAVRAGMEACRDGTSEALCWEFDQLLRQYPELAPLAAGLMEEIARSARADAKTKERALGWLVVARHPYGLAVGMERLRAVAPLAATHVAAQVLTAEPPAASYLDSDGIAMVGAYGPAAIAAGPLAAPFLEARGLPGARAAAALTVGQIGYAPAAATLLAQQADFETDWFLAYNAAESLGRLGVGEDVLRAMARDHWSRPVRNNARRGLNFMRTGSFTLPGVAGEGAPWEGSFFLPVRHAADDLRDSTGKATSCPATASRPYPQFRPAAPWPSRSVGAVLLERQRAEAAQVRRFLTSHPTLKLPRDYPPVLAAPLGRYWIVGTSAGEWGGAVHALGPGGEVRTLVKDNALAVFPLDDGLLVVTGLSHMGVSTGDLWFIGLDRNGPEVRRRIPLPITPWRYTAVWPRTLIVHAGGEDFAVTSAGKLINAETVEGCNR